MEQPKKRMPAKERKILEIKENDVRVKILGIVIDRNDSTMVIDDGSGNLEVIAENAPEIGKFIKAILRILPLMQGFEARLESFQNMDSFDMELYKQAKETISNSIKQ